MLGYLVELPFWASILAAAFLYAVFRFGSPFLAGTSLIGTALATFFPTIAPWLAIAALAAGLTGVGKRQWRHYLLSRGISPHALRQMEWHDFELLVGEAYRQQGYSVTERGGRLPDGGIDLELALGREKVIVQCKHWRNRQVPVQRVRELFGVVAAEGADRGILVATSGFTRDAMEFAAGKPLQLVDGNALTKLVRRSVGGTDAQPSNVSAQPPSCPTCGRSMVSRTARRGRTAGSQFWGCTAYPDCRGTRAA
jgi:restriction system protein